MNNNTIIEIYADGSMRLVGSTNVGTLLRIIDTLRQVVDSITINPPQSPDENGEAQ